MDIATKQNVIALEIERKWLLDKVDYIPADIKRCYRTYNFYVKNDTGVELRLRKMARYGNEEFTSPVSGENLGRYFFLDFKSERQGCSRLETCLSLRMSEWYSILVMHQDNLSLVVKDCYEVDLESGQVLEVCHILDRGMWLAEVELKSAEEAVQLPDWLPVSKEVTNQDDYYGAFLATPASYDIVINSINSEDHDKNS